jgi:hypothetical protein
VTELLFGPGGKRLWVKWLVENAARTESEAEPMRSFYADLPGQLTQIMMVLHSLANPSGLKLAISAKTVAAALELVEYHQAEVRKAIGTAATIGAQAAA